MGGKAEHGGVARRTLWMGGMTKHGGVARRTVSTQCQWCMQHLYVMTNDSKLVYAIKLW